MEDNYVYCDQCEEAMTCPDANRMDGCEFGIKKGEDDD